MRRKNKKQPRATKNSAVPWCFCYSHVFFFRWWIPRRSWKYRTSACSDLTAVAGDILSHSVKRSPGSPLPAGCKAKVDQQRSLVCKEEKLPSGDEVETAGGGVGWGGGRTWEPCPTQNIINHRKTRSPQDQPNVPASKSVTAVSILAGLFGTLVLRCQFLLEFQQDFFLYCF